MTTFSGQLKIKPTLAHSLRTNAAFDPSLSLAHQRLEQKILNKPPLTVTLGEVKDFDAKKLAELGVDTSTVPPTALVATLDGCRELKGLVPACRRWFSGFSNPTEVHELLVMSDGHEGIGKFLKDVQKTLSKEIFWAKFIPLKPRPESSAAPATPHQAIQRNIQPTLPAVQPNSFQARA